MNVLEANMLGTPAIGYRVEGLQETIKDNVTGFLAPKYDVDKMAEKAVDLLKDKKQYQKMQEECQRWASKFSWGKSITKSLEVIRSINN